MIDLEQLAQEHGLFARDLAAWIAGSPVPCSCTVAPPTRCTVCKCRAYYRACEEVRDEKRKAAQAL